MPCNPADKYQLWVFTWTAGAMTHTHTHTDAHTHTHTHTHTDARMHARTHAHTHTRSHAHTRTHAHTHTQTHARTHAHTHTLSSQGPKRNFLPQLPRNSEKCAKTISYWPWKCGLQYAFYKNIFVFIWQLITEQILTNSATHCSVPNST